MSSSPHTPTPGSPPPDGSGSNPSLSKVEAAKASLCGLDLEPELPRLAAEGWEQLDEATLTIHLKWLGIFFRPVTPGRFMVRLRLPNGVIQADQLAFLADVVDRCGDHGSADITTRQNLQLRGLLLEDMAPLLEGLQRHGMTSRQSGHDNPRNITGNPFAGIDPEEIVDTRPLVAAIQERLLAADAPRNLPRKFNIAVGGAPDSFLLHNDLAFLPADRDGEPGFTVMVGGFFSAQRNELAIPLGLWLRGDQLPLFSLATLRHFARCGNRQARNKSRLMYLIDELGLAGYRQAVQTEFQSLGGESHPHDGSHNVHQAPRSGLGLHRQRQDGRFWMGLSVPMGRFDAAGMQALSELAERYGTGELRLTEAQNVLIPHIPGDQLEALRAEPLLQRYSPEPGPLMAEAVSCTGNRYCSFALIPTKSTAQSVVDELERRLELPHPVRSHWTGCPNACGQPYLGEIGLMGAKARHNGQMVEAVKVMLGGSMGSDPQLASLHHKGVPLSELADVLEALLIERFGARPRSAVA